MPSSLGDQAALKGVVRKVRPSAHGNLVRSWVQALKESHPIQKEVELTQSKVSCQGFGITYITTLHKESSS